jgi:hypothetical protein
MGTSASIDRLFRTALENRFPLLGSYAKKEAIMARQSIAGESVHTAALTWTAVAAGVIASLIVQVILVMIGFGVGLISADTSSSTSLPIWLIFAWWVASGIFAAAVGGWICGTLSPTVDEGLKGLGGLTTWAVATLIIVAVSGVTLGSGASSLSALGGPVIAATEQLKTAQNTSTNRENRETVGQAKASLPSADEARKSLATAMWVSACALIAGAFAAYFAARSSSDRDLLEERL